MVEEGSSVPDKFIDLSELMKKAGLDTSTGIEKKALDDKGLIESAQEETKRVCYRVAGDIAKSAMATRQERVELSIDYEGRKIVIIYSSKGI